MWRSLVAHFVRDEGAAGSNPVIPKFWFYPRSGLKAKLGWLCFLNLRPRRQIVQKAKAAGVKSCYPENN